MAKKITLILLPLLLTTTILALITLRSQPLLSPLNQLLSPISSALGLPVFTKSTQKVIYGFLPYWMMKESPYLRYHLLTHVAYFGLDFDEQGNIVKTTPDSFAEPGWRHLQGEVASKIFRLTKSHRGQTIIVLRAMTQSVIESIVNSPARRQKVIAASLSVMSSKNFDGINIDFEYAGTPDAKTRQNFGLFVEELSTACKLQNRYCQIDIDVFADSATSYRLWDYAKITPHVDHVIIMAYDFFRSSSTQAGPVAPLRGACSAPPTASLRSLEQRGKPVAKGGEAPCFELDVTETVADFVKIVPAAKILLGVPYYGYQWQTASTQPLANTYPDSGSMATFRRIQSLLAQKDAPPKDQQVFGIQNFWDNQTFSSRLVFRDSAGQINQIYYDDEHALSLKYDLVNQAGLGGIAIWALGYDGEYPQLWDLLEQKFFSP